MRVAKTWIGEELIFMDEAQKFHYTARTVKVTRVLAISKADMFEKLGRLYPDYFKVLLRRTHTRYKMHK